MKQCADENQPFVCYLPTNAPHFPQWVAEQYSKPFEDLGPKLARYYGMIVNLDENMGRLEKFLADNGLRAKIESVPAGVALPVAAAHLTAAGQDLDQKTPPGAKFATFTVKLPAGPTKLHGWFRDASGKDLCGAFWAYIRRV